MESNETHRQQTTSERYLWVIVLTCIGYIGYSLATSYDGINGLWVTPPLQVQQTYEIDRTASIPPNIEKLPKKGLQEEEKLPNTKGLQEDDKTHSTTTKENRQDPAEIQVTSKPDSTSLPPTPSPTRPVLAEVEVSTFKWWDPIVVTPPSDSSEAEIPWVRYCGDQYVASTPSAAIELLKSKATLGSMKVDEMHDGGIAVVSTGRVSSKLVRSLIKKAFKRSKRTVNVYHRHFRAFRYPYSFPNDTRAIFLYGDPIGVVLSLHQKVLELGCLEASRWTKLHARNIGAKRSWRLAIIRSIQTGNCDEWVDMMMDQDVLRQADFVEGFHQSHNYPMLSVRYEGSYTQDVADAIAWYSTTEEDFPGFPAVGQLVSGSLSVVPREERWKRLTKDQRSRLTKTYGQLQEMVNRAPKVCLWPPIESKNTVLVNPALANTTWFDLRDNPVPD